MGETVGTGAGSMGSEGEEVIGEVSVSAQLARGQELLRLVVTTRRLIIVHRGKRGAGALASTSLLGGGFSTKLESMVKGGQGSPRKAKPGDVSPDDILKTDKDNFQITYDELVLAELSSSRQGVGIMVLTRDDKFQFNASAPLESLESLFRAALGGKLNVVR